MTSRRQLISEGIRVRLKKLRKRTEYSQKEIAALLGMTASAYSKYELGLNFLSIEAMQRMSEKLDVSMDWLLFNKGSMYNSENRRRETESEKETVPVQELKVEPGIDLNPEERELFEEMKRVPMLYHRMMGKFYEFKLENPSFWEPPPTAA